MAEDGGTPIAETSDRDAIDLIVVASWFPAYDDPAKGRFVGDQVDALAATGAVEPAVISFDPVRLTGGATSRSRQADVVLAAGREAAARAAPLFVAGVDGLHPSVRVARLTIPEGLTRGAGRAHGAVHRAALLAAAAERVRELGEGGTKGASTGIVHAHTAYPDGAAAVALADRLGWPLFVTEHASFVARQITEPAVREAYAGVLARAERLFAVSTMLADELRAAFPAHADTIAVLPNAVPVERFPLVPIAERRPDELLFVGYRKATKGIETLLRATAIAHARRPSISLRLVGHTTDDAEERGWHELAASLEIADVVSFESAQDRDGVAAALARASVFVHPSPRETFGVVAVEALASGMPVVAADSGGVTEILGAQPELLGALVAPDDAGALADAIVATLERRESFDPVLLRAAVETRFGAAFVAERLLVEYRQALAGWDRGSGPATVPAPGPAPASAAIGAADAGFAADTLVVVALDRESAAAHLAALPEALLASLTLVSAAEPAGIALPRVGRFVEVAVDPSWRVTVGRDSLRGRPGWLGRMARLASDPRGTIARRSGRDAGAERSLAPATAALRDLATAMAVVVLAVDGHDHLAVDPVIRAGLARRSDGGLRRLADLHEAGGRPG